MMPLTRRGFIGSFLAAAALALPGSVWADPVAEASTVLASVHASAIAMLQADRGEANDLRARLEALLASNLDLAHMAARALASKRELMSEEQFAEFSREYAHFLTEIYLQELAWVRADGAELEILSAELDPKSGRVAIRTRAQMRPSMANVARSKRYYPKDFEASYLMKSVGEGWKIAVIRFNGVDLNRVFGAQFAALLDRGSAESLIAKLRERNAQSTKKNPFAGSESQGAAGR